MAQLSVTNFDKAVGKRIQTRRKELSLTAWELSEKIGISQQQLSRYERGENKINITHLIQIATFLNTPITWFLLDCALDEIQGDDGLRSRLDHHWQSFSLDQKKAMIHFLDFINKNQ